MKHHVLVPLQFVERGRLFGRELVHWYAHAGAGSASRSRSGDRGTESNPIILGQSKVGESAAAIFLKLDPNVAIKWDVGSADQGEDCRLPSGKKIDVKTTEKWKRFLIWSRDVNDLYWSKQFDFLLGVSIDEHDWSRCWIDGYISKEDFFIYKKVADGGDVGPGLQRGTWFVEKRDLRDAAALLLDTDIKEPIQICRVCLLETGRFERVTFVGAPVGGVPVHHKCIVEFFGMIDRGRSNFDVV